MLNHHINCKRKTVRSRTSRKKSKMGHPTQHRRKPRLACYAVAFMTRTHRASIITAHAWAASSLIEMPSLRCAALLTDQYTQRLAGGAGRPWRTDRVRSAQDDTDQPSVTGQRRSAISWSPDGGTAMWRGKNTSYSQPPGRRDVLLNACGRLRLHPPRLLA